MFLKYLAPLYEPIKFIRNKLVKSQTAVGKVRVDVGRVKSYKNLAKSQAKQAKQKAKDAKGKAKGLKEKAAAKKAQWGGGAQQPQPAAAGGYGGAGGAPAGAAGYGGGAPGGAPMGAGGMAMQGGNPQGGYPPPGGGGWGPQGGGPQVAPNPAAGYGGPQPGYPGGAPGGGPPGGPGGGPGAVNGGSNGIVVSGALWWKKHLCANCGQELDKTWDRCPYCSVQAVVAAPNKTQAIMMDYAGMGTGMQLLGWLVSISRGPQRGELFTLQPMTTVGTDPTCTVVLADSYMSSRHCEIKAEGGIWVLRDLKSTNGTYVNDRRVEQHELVDNDFIKVGQSLLKFKSL